jgi:hypothetical protein
MKGIMLAHKDNRLWIQEHWMAARSACAIAKEQSSVRLQNGKLKSNFQKKKERKKKKPETGRGHVR